MSRRESQTASTLRPLAAIMLFFALLTASADCRADATVLLYHRFGEDRYPTTSVPAAAFVRQMDWLAENGYRVVDLADIVDSIEAGRPVADKTVAITIDDDYRSLYTVAWPVFRRHGYPFTVFVYGEATDRGYRDFLSWRQVEEMAAAGVAFANHGYAHPHFGMRPRGMGDEAYRQWIRADLRRGAALIAEHTGQRSDLLALPYGEYTAEVLAVAREEGYRAVFTQTPGAVSEHTDPMMIPREPILGRDWSTLDHFRAVLRRIDLPLAELRPGIEPFAGVLPERVGARVLSPGRFQEGSFMVYVSELGWRKAERDGDLYFRRGGEVLTERVNRIAVSAREKGSGREALRFWLVVGPSSVGGRE
ncbi:MAG: polysaccharide deacetylase family protein [Thermodesulfobacteriota bacterium]